ncbi:MAG: tetratricopeptide repeat protein [candidate division FCPU426 bacterium]
MIRIFLLAWVALASAAGVAGAEEADSFEAVDRQFRASFCYASSLALELQGDNNNAVQMLKRAVESDPNSAFLRSELERVSPEPEEDGKRLYRQQQYAEAEKAFSKSLERDPKDKESLLLRGMSRLQSKKYGDAETDFLALGRLEKENPGHLYGLGLSQLGQGKRDAAEKTFKKLLKLQATAVPAYVQLAFIYDKTSRTAEAVELLKAGVAQNPDSGELVLLLAAGYSDAGENSKVEKVLLDGISKVTDNGALRFQLAVYYDKAGDFLKCQATLESLIEAEPKNAPALNYLGYSYLDRGLRLKEAEALIRRALKEDPGNHYYLDSLGWACYKAGRYKEARDLLVQASKALDEPDVEEAVVFEHLGKTYEKLGDKKNAKANLDRAEHFRSLGRPHDR